MENHPIPQDITGFQFKLIGNMTVKQFIYLATGTILAWFTFFILPLHFLIRFPLAVIFLGGGIALAFLPIEGRPMDIMISNFIRALFAPTQYIYKKEGGNLATTETLRSPQETQSESSVNSMGKSVPSVIAMPESLAQTPAPSPQPIEPVNEVPSFPSSILSLDEEPEIPAAEPKVVASGQSEIENQLLETIRQKEALEKELLTLKAKLEGQQSQKPTPSAVPAAEAPAKEPHKAKKAPDVPTAPQDPNLIVGVVKDPRGNPLSNILVEVKDNEDNPVRAFKTNTLGQFASATSLSNGVYTLTFEDPAGTNKFDAVQVEATGAPIMPLEIFSVDPREELRRELFN